MKSILSCLISMGALSSLIAQAQFEDRSQQAGINNVGFNRGVAVVDFNQDGWEDVYFTRLMGTNFLYQNNGNGTFTNVSETSGLAYTGNSTTSAWGDLDNDGWPDMVLGNRDEPSLVYRNNGDGTFTDITSISGIQNTGKVQAVLLADINNDGWLDLYFANLGTENALFINDGNGQFKDLTQEFGATDNQIAMGAVFFDYDNDGDQDLYLTHDTNQPNILYRNNGYGHFEDVSEEAGVNFAGQGMGVDAGDFNQDGYLDIYITNLYENTLFLNNRNGTFSDLSSSAGVTDLGMGWGTSWLDYNNDSWPDLYVSNETYFSVNGSYYPNVLYQNLGNGSFDIASSASVVESPLGGYGMACADFDKDGRLDIVIANSGATDGNQLFTNKENNGNHWVILQLEGRLSNRSAIGARVTLTAGDLELCDQVIAGSGFASQNSLKLHFGLGEINQIDEVNIYWPSGEKETFEQLAVDQYYHIIEQTAITSTPDAIEQETGILKIFPNPVHDALSFEFYLPTQKKKFHYRILDTAGKLVAQKTVAGLPDGRKSEDWTLPATLPSGVYFLEIIGEHTKVVDRFILKR